MKRASLIILTLGLLACQEDYYPPGLYGYQVERLLTRGDTGIWYLSSKQLNGQNHDISSCENALELHFHEAGDSINVYEVNTCVPRDTIYFGSMHASSASGSETNRNVFTDSLIFEFGAVDYVIVDEVSSTQFKFYLFSNQGRENFTYLSE